MNVYFLNKNALFLSFKTDKLFGTYISKKVKILFENFLSTIRLMKQTKLFNTLLLKRTILSIVIIILFLTVIFFQNYL